MTLLSLAHSALPRARLPEWPPGAYLEQLETKHLGYGVMCQVFGFDDEPILCPVHVFEEPDGGRWEAYG